MHIAILSPHRDDAAFSCGLTMYALLQAGAHVTVVNVFTRSDYAIDLRTVGSALPAVDAVSQARRLEDERFIADIASLAAPESGCVRLYDLHRLDAPLRLSVRTEQVLESPLTDAEVAEQAADLAAQLTAVPAFDLLYAPFALGDHIDHRVAREAAKLCTPADRLCLYEDLPYAARLSPEAKKEQSLHVATSNQPIQFARFNLRVPHGQHLKQRFAMHYPSQIAPEVADEMAEYAERKAGDGGGAECWWATRAAGQVVADALRSARVPCGVIEEQQ